MKRDSVEDLAEEVRERYRAAGRAEKTRILGELVAMTGYHRKAAIRLLNRQPGTGSGRPRGRPRIYGPEVARGARILWEAAAYIGARRLQPAIGELLAHPEAAKELSSLEPKARALLGQLSEATLDRLLQPARVSRQRRRQRWGPSVTHLRKTVPIKTFADWDECTPGSVQMDLVAHCGGSAEGFHLYTLTAVDVASGWVELEALWGRGQQQVLAAIDKVRRRLPVPLLALDCDNGSEFINYQLVKHCREAGITLTRGRPRKKNDNAHVEQKNGALVRELVGHTRFTTVKAYEQLQILYSLVRLHSNFFQPVRKVVRKSWANGRQKRDYDRAQTPYRRLCQSRALGADAETTLEGFYNELNPLLLKRQIDTEVQRLWSLRTRIGRGPDTRLLEDGQSGRQTGTFGNRIYETEQKIR